MANWFAWSIGNAFVGQSQIFINGTVTLDQNRNPVVQASVGSQIRFWNSNYRTVSGKSLVEVDWSSTVGKMISSDPSLTNYSRSVGKYSFVPQNWVDRAIISPGPSDTVFNDWAHGGSHSNGGWGNYDVEKIAFYVDATVGLQVWTAVMKFDDGTSTYIVWNINVTSPSTTSGTSLSFTYPTGANAFQFGPWLISNTNAPITIENTPVSWGNLAYWTGGISQDYALGCQTGGINNFNFSGVIVNNTFSTGTAYCVQLGKNKGPDEIVFAKTGCNKHVAAVASFLGVSRIVDGYYYFPPAPADVSGNTLYGCDSVGNNTSSHPWAYQTNAFTVPTPNGPAFPVPPVNSIPDINGNLNSYYTDNPGLLQHVEPLSLYTTVDIEFNFDGDYKTYLVWEPDNGIPIGMIVQPWGVRCNTYNANADTQLTWQAGRAFQNNWSNLGGIASYIFGEAVGPFNLEWSYFLGDYAKMSPVFVSRGWTVSSNSPNSGPTGGSTFGGASVMAAFNGRGLPNGSSANVGGANVGVIG